MATLLLARSPGDAGFLLRKTMRLDDVAVARLRPGERVRVTLAPGTYVVQATSGGSTCAPVTLNLGDGHSARVIAEHGQLGESWNAARMLQLRVRHESVEREVSLAREVSADGSDAPPPSRRRLLWTGASVVIGLLVLCQAVVDTVHGRPGLLVVLGVTAAVGCLVGEAARRAARREEGR
ncbi:hypothetical protein FE697_005915 [Mumia zhuanghuii]|uniref:Uncharacterized protein n=2 Tax=Mumia TaxID=1546255 RepID=A0ABW1QJB9_9ACTN|nr:MULTISPECIES: hypothetical protein [Mumia]KAA1425386.1 hypothetical protein FE697_005915 [Mumia zhuanghuii]